MDLSLYKETDLEKWINKLYHDHGIHYAADMDLDNIASIFNIEVRTYKGPSFAEWKEEEYSFVFLNAYLTKEQKREVFFHEICHPLKHVGMQEKLPTSFQQLQEIQAAHFQLYSAMPIYMFDEFKDVNDALLPKILWEEFCLPERLVLKRLEQIHSRIQQAQYDIELHVSRRQVRLLQDYTSETKRLLNQLSKQLKHDKSKGA